MMNDDGRFGMSLGAFNDKVDAQDLRREWEEWHRAFELILQMRKIESQPEKLVTMLTIGGRGLQRIFYNLRPVADEIIPEPVKVPLMPPEVPEYDNAVKRLEKFFVGKRNERVELEVFRSLKQSSEESFNNFVLRLRAQAARCEFSDREETELLQQITMGARDEKVRDKGLENVMSLDEVITYAMNREILLKQREKQKPFCSEAELHSEVTSDLNGSQWVGGHGQVMVVLGQNVIDAVRSGTPETHVSVLPAKQVVTTAGNEATMQGSAEIVELIVGIAHRDVR
nr:uncharacterized protein LOC115253765 [Aedes albopictus]